MSKPTSRTAYSYLRFSTAEQMAGDSQRRQTSKADKACAEFNWQLSSRTYKDCGVSAFRGKNRKRGDLSLFLIALEKGELEQGAVLILEDFDRLSRDKIMASFDLVRRILEAGIDIFCVLNWRLYTKESLNEPFAIMEMLWRFYLAHEESAKKAFRSKENWSQKRAKAKETIMTSLCPAWLKVVDERFVIIPERVSVVKKIFQWCIAGNGIHGIMKRLASEKIPPFKSGWGQKYIYEILTDGKVRGDLPSKCYGETVIKRDAITGYYPAIVDEQTFDSAQLAIRSRKGKSGRKGDFINLFTGLVQYPEHDGTMVFISKPKKNKSGLHPYKYLVSFKGWKGLAPYVAVPYGQFENVILSWMYELKPSELAEKKEDGLIDLQTEYDFTVDRITELTNQLDQVGVSLPTVVKKLAELETRKKELLQAIKEKKQERTRPTLEDTKTLLELLRKTPEKEVRPLRERLRQRLALLIRRIDVSVQQKSKSKRWPQLLVFCTIVLRSGVSRRVWFDTSKPDLYGLWTDDGSINVGDMDFAMRHLWTAPDFLQISNADPGA